MALKVKLVKMQGCHRQLTVKAGDQMEDVTVKAVPTAYPPDLLTLTLESWIPIYQGFSATLPNMLRFREQCHVMTQRLIGLTALEPVASCRNWPLKSSIAGMGQRKKSRLPPYQEPSRKFKSLLRNTSEGS